MSDIIGNPWMRLRSFTAARLALGRAGDSLPTREVLEFGLAHAQARDAVHHALDIDRLAKEIAACGMTPLLLQSAAPDRGEYLRRPDLGRSLSEESRTLIAAQSAIAAQPMSCDVVFIIGDGLSAIALERHAVVFLQAMREKLAGWRMGPVCAVKQARVAIGDEIGEALRAEMTVMLIGERPGLSSPDSLGIYLTYKPRVGCTDAERNCISNVRPEGLSYEAAAGKLYYLMTMARKMGASGIALKDESDSRQLP